MIKPTTLRHGRRQDPIDAMLSSGAIGDAGHATGATPYAELAALFAALQVQRPAAGTEDVLAVAEVAMPQGLAATVAATIRTTPIATRPGHSLRTALSTGIAKILLSLAILLGGATAAAAATDSLPGPIQHTISRALGAIGIHVPGGTSGAKGHRPAPAGGPLGAGSSSGGGLPPGCTTTTVLATGTAPGRPDNGCGHGTHPAQSRTRDTNTGRSGDRRNGQGPGASTTTTTTNPGHGASGSGSGHAGNGSRSGHSSRSGHASISRRGTGSGSSKSKGSGSSGSGVSAHSKDRSSSSSQGSGALTEPRSSIEGRSSGTGKGAR